MRTYRIELQKAARKFIEKQDKQQRLRLYKAIYMLPQGTDIRRLAGTKMYRLRVGDFRILYEIDNGVYKINVINIDNRGQVYKNL